MSTQKLVLVSVGENRRPVAFIGGVNELKKAVQKKFRDCLKSDEIIVQIKSEDWDGEFIDVKENDDIPDRSVVKVIPAKVCFVLLKALESILYLACTAIGFD